jgi:cardiolipin synthase
LLPSGADYPLEGFQSLLVWQVHQARSHVIMVTPYFIPDEGLLAALRTAVARGVRVDLVLSGVVDQPIVNLSQSSYYESLLVAGVNIYLYRGFLLHAKNVGIDGRLAIVGSSNVDLRSFQLNQEASLLLYDLASVERVNAIHKGYLAGSDRLEPEVWRGRPTRRRFVENIARLFNSLL